MNAYLLVLLLTSEVLALLFLPFYKWWLDQYDCIVAVLLCTAHLQVSVLNLRYSLRSRKEFMMQYTQNASEILDVIQMLSNAWLYKQMLTLNCTKEQYQSQMKVYLSTGSESWASLCHQTCSQAGKSKLQQNFYNVQFAILRESKRMMVQMK